MKKDVLFILKDDGNEGSNNSARKLVELITSKSKNARILYLDKDSSKPLIFKENGSIYLNHPRLRKHNFLSSVFSIVKNLNNLTCFFYSLRKRKVVVNNATLLDILIVSLITKHETFVFLRETHLPTLFLFVIKLLSKFTGLKVLSNNCAIKNQIEGVNISVVNNYVDLHDQGVDLSPCKDRIRILSVGSIYPLKNQIALVELAKSLLGIVNFKIDIYGSVIDEAYHMEVKNLISQYGLDEYISMKGQISNDKLMIEYSKYHVFIQSSSFEGMSRALMDALSIGQYCIATDVGDTNRLLIDSCGLLVSKNFDREDIESIKNKLRFIQAEPSLVASDVYRARENIRINFSYQSCIKQLEKVNLIEI
ncbi:glycosyltransferase [Shewanella indica]|uniref:glycosyltransferase family 4 protein n=1 Tax=Shewanella indica TaxID=768528 RepID=UPI0030079BA0